MDTSEAYSHRFLEAWRHLVGNQFNDQVYLAAVMKSDRARLQAINLRQTRNRGRSKCKKPSRLRLDK